MIFTDSKLTGNTVNVRWHRYSDPNMGWGDAGTEMYAIYPLNAFVEKENERLPKGCNDFYYTYEFTEEWSEKLKKSMGDYWWIGRNYELADEKKRQAEIAEATAMLENAMTIKKFL